MSRSVLRDARLQAEFSKNGYVTVPMLDEAEVAHLIEALASLTPGDNWEPDGNGPAQNSYHCSFLDLDREYKRRAFDLLASSFASVLDRYLENYRVLSSNFYIKPVGQGLIPVHQNWPVLRSLDDTSVTVWCPLVDVNPQNGTLHLIPGSQKLFPHVEGPGSLSYFSDFRDDLDDMLVALNADAGEGIIFDDSLVHGSPDNAATVPRVAVQITCIPNDQDPVFYFRREDGQFELVDADCEFYIDNSIVDLLERQDCWPDGPIRPSQNRQVGKAEFAAAVERAMDQGESKQSSGLVERMKQFLRPTKAT